MNKNFKFVFLIVFCFSFFFSKSIFASVLTLDTPNKIIKTGDSFIVQVLLDTENASINTIEGDLTFDQNALFVEDVPTNDSFISFWIDQPKVKNSNRIHFSGIVPGGITANKGIVFSIVFKTLKQTKTSISLSNLNLYLNDGEATFNKVDKKDLDISISDKAQHIDIEKKVDNIAPESFKIERTHNEYLFDNKNFIVFNTQDKGSGIAYYKVCELFSKCIESESPYLLKNQSTFYVIKVLAYDQSLNVKQAYLISTAIIILTSILALILIAFIIYKYYRSFKRNKL